jgi:hypothetical protein
VDDSIPGSDVCSGKVRADKLRNSAIQWYKSLDHNIVFAYITQEIGYGMFSIAFFLQMDAGDCITLCVYLLDLIFRGVT